jgi:hypothetical protein
MVKIFPHPTKGIYTIESSDFDFKINKIIVFDVFGNQFIHIENPSEKQVIDLSNSPNGIYHVSAIFDQTLPPIRIKLYNY